MNKTEIMQESLFSGIRQFKVSDEIVRYLKALIKEGKLKPGDRMPPERTLAQWLGVGRSTLREAIKTLATLGFVEIRERRGTYVKSFGAAVIPDSFAQVMDEDRTKVRELYEIRKDLEVASAYMAAGRRTAADLIQMERSLSLLEQQQERPRLGIKEDIEFHLAVARASGNTLRMHVLENLFDRYGHYIDIARQPLLGAKGHNARVCEHHRAIYEAIRRRDPEKAREAMSLHLTWVERGLSE